MRKRWCSVCARPDVSDINKDILDPVKSLRTLAKVYEVRRETLARHRDRCVSEKVAKALEIRRETAVALEVSATGSAIDVLIAEARRDRAGALERGDHRLALRSIDTLLKAHELHARLVIEASNASAKDVASNPAFQRFIALQAGRLCCSCSQATAQLAREHLGLDVPVTVRPL
jgi:hypothetical protein